MPVKKKSNDMHLVLEKLYRKYNRRKFVHPDPLEFLYNYGDLRDREIAGLIASSLAYGRVQQILKSVGTVLEKMSPSPYEFLLDNSDKYIEKTFKGFKHRFTTDDDISRLLIGIKHTIKKHGSLEDCFLSNYNDSDTNILPALTHFVNNLDVDANHLLPSPDQKSACKRLNLFLRWMVRSDEVDPGGWNEIPASKLIVPLDTHMHKIGKKLGFSSRKQANLKTAMEIADAFAAFSPDDPVKYDFCLTRMGIHPKLDKNLILDSAIFQKNFVRTF